MPKEKIFDTFSSICCLLPLDLLTSTPTMVDCIHSEIHSFHLAAAPQVSPHDGIAATMKMEVHVARKSMCNGQRMDDIQTIATIWSLSLT
jgi:hypothetical protein